MRSAQHLAPLRCQALRTNEALPEAERLFYAGSCSREAAPQEACAAYYKFLQLSPKDNRAPSVEEFIIRQPISKQPKCLLPPIRQSVKAQSEAIEIRSWLAGRGGCRRGILMLEAYQERFGKDSDYYYLRFYCAYNDSPAEACFFGLGFLKSGSSDLRRGIVRRYITQEEKAQTPGCVL